jgi:pimeloyl-ACP methyl ester carboxylesterase
MTDRFEKGTSFRDRISSTLWAGLLFGAAALVAAPFAGLEITAAFVSEEGRVTWLMLFVGAFLTGCLFWWLLISRPQRISLLRGAVTGMFVGFFSYPAVLLLAEVVQRSLAAEVDAASYEARGGSVLMTIGLMLMTSGFASVAIMAGVGMLAALVLLRFRPGATAVAAQDARSQSGLARRLLWTAAGVAGFIFAVLIGAFVWLSLLPLNTAGLAYSATTTKPAETYQDAMAAFLAIRTRENAGVPLHERCPSTLLTHGKKVARVVIYYHGLTSCPAQGDALAAKLFGLGYNVYLPRMFGHGEADPLTLSLAQMRAEDLVQLANESADMAQGLGEEVVVIGLSAGGTVASWSAQYRHDVDVSISVSPFFGPHIVPGWANHAATNLLLMLPNAMVWWNPLETVRPPELDYAYARYATHGLAQTMRLGAIVASSARATPPASPNVAMLLNDADVAVNQALAEQVIASWRNNGRDVNVQVLPFWHRLPHDLINPREPAGNTDLIYPILLDMMDGTAGP